MGAQRGEAALPVDEDDDDFGDGYGDDFEADEERERESMVAAVSAPPPGRLRDRIKLCRGELIDALGQPTFDLAYRVLKARSWDEYEVGGESFEELSKILAVRNYEAGTC